MSKVIRGDCIDVCRDMRSNSIDLIFTSPPYAGIPNKYINGFQATPADNYVDWFIPRVVEFERVLNNRGSFILNMNEPTAETAGQFTMISGTAKWNSSGGIILGTIGNQAIWEDNVFRKGHDYFNITATMNGGTLSNYTVEFQKDVGSGYGGTWLDATQLIHLNVQTIDPAIGFRMKIRITTTTTNTVAITSLIFGTVSTYASQQNLYDLDTNTFTLTNLPSGVEVRIRQGSKTLSQAQSVTSGYYSFYHALAGKKIRAQMTLPGYTFEDIEWELTASDVSLPVTYSPDPSYI